MKSGTWKCRLCSTAFSQPFLEKEHACLKNSSPDSLTAKESQPPTPDTRPNKRKLVILGVVGLALLAFLYVTQQPAVEAEIVVKWESPHDMFHESEWELVGQWFALYRGPENNPGQIESMLYLGLLSQGETAASLVNRIATIYPSLGRDDSRVYFSFGQILGHSTSADPVLNTDSQLLAVTQGMAKVIEKNTPLKDYQGRNQSTQVGLDNPMKLIIELVDLPLPGGQPINLKGNVTIK